jgi:hypothetical protein
MFYHLIIYKKDNGRCIIRDFNGSIMAIEDSEHKARQWSDEEHARNGSATDPQTYDNETGEVIE